VETGKAAGGTNPVAEVVERLCFWTSLAINEVAFLTFYSTWSEFSGHALGLCASFDLDCKLPEGYGQVYLSPGKPVTPLRIFFGAKKYTVHWGYNCLSLGQWIQPFLGWPTHSLTWCHVELTAFPLHYQRRHKVKQIPFSECLGGGLCTVTRSSLYNTFNPSKDSMRHRMAT
jgi:hypothetical protein